MEIIDTDAMMNAPSSKFLKKEEFEHLFKGSNEHLPYRKNFIFKYEIPLNIDDDIGNILLKKYPRLKRADGISVNKYTKTKYNSLKKIATGLGIPYKDTMVPKEELRKMIISKETELAKD